MTIPTTEAEFMSQVIELSRLTGWLCYHTHDSRHSQAGFPDLVLTKELKDGNAACIMAELKSEKGKLTIEQKEWLEPLSKVKGLFVFVWRPADFDDIEEILKTEGVRELELCR